MSTNQLSPTWMNVSSVPINGTSMGASITSDAVQFEFSDNVGIQATWTGTPTGTFDVQISLDPTNLGWTSVPFSPLPTAPAGAAGNNYFEINQSTGGFVRLLYTRVSGTGNLKAKIAIKAV